MAKRHPSLKSLSHDHHHGLALALRLQQGDKALLNDGWTHDRIEQAKRVRAFYVEDLRPHFQIEEEILFPLMRSSVPSSTDLVATLEQQHRQIEGFISSLGIAESGLLDGLLAEFGNLLTLHIRLEERQLFPMFESDISEAMKTELVGRMNTAHALARAAARTR